MSWYFIIQHPFELILGFATSMATSIRDGGDSQARGAGTDSPRRPRLSESDAWDVVLAWHDQLEGCVELETSDKRLPTSIIETSEWVSFHFDYGRYSSQKTAACARAAVTTWYALSCCEGYGGKENPHFWKRVLGELRFKSDHPPYRPDFTRPSPPRPSATLTNGVVFFPHSDRPFPRIKVHIGEKEDDETIESVFLGQLPYEDTERDTELERILTKLQPFIRVSEATRRIPVQIDLKIHRRPALNLRNVPFEMEPVAASSVAGLMAFPQLYLRSVMLLDNAGAYISNLHSQIPPSDVEVIARDNLYSVVRDHQLCRGLLDQLQGTQSENKPRRWRVWFLRVDQPCDQSYSYLSVLASALPHLQSISTLMVPSNLYSKETSEFIATNWAWLGYAIFHPDAASTSGLTGIVVNIEGITQADIAALARMARGNNLREDSLTSYVQVRVRIGTQVKDRAVADDEPSLYTFKAESWIDVCTPVHEASHDSWVCVIVPGRGSGWIRHDAIIGTRSRRPGLSSIRALAFHGCSMDAHEEVVTKLLGVLGDRLTSLHFEDTCHVPTRAVQRIMRLCPSLTSLRIHHDGSYWADEENAMALPRLEELELTVNRRGTGTVSHLEALDAIVNATRGGTTSRRERHLVVTPLYTEALRPLHKLKPACLPYLKALHVISEEEDGFKKHEPILLSFLSNQPMLQYLRWSRGSDILATWSRKPFSHRRETNENFLKQLPVEHQLSQGPLSIHCRLAFLSVIYEQASRASSGSIGQIAADVATLIFQFATSTTPREICIQP